MDWFTLIFGSIALLVQSQSDYYKETDRIKTFPESVTELYIPTVEAYDFIIGITILVIINARLHYSVLNFMGFLN